MILLCKFTDAGTMRKVRLLHEESSYEWKTINKISYAALLRVKVAVMRIKKMIKLTLN